MEFTVNVEKIDLAERIGAHYDEDGDRVHDGTLADLVVRRLVDGFARSDSYKGLAGRIQAIRDEEIRAQVAPLIAEAFDKPITLTNSYGEPSGRTSSLRELIVAEAKGYMSAPADNYNRGKGTRLEIAVRQAVDAAFKDEIAEAVKVVRETVAKQFGGSVAEGLAKAVTDALRTAR